MVDPFPEDILILEALSTEVQFKVALRTLEDLFQADLFQGDLQILEGRFLADPF